MLFSSKKDDLDLDNVLLPHSLEIPFPWSVASSYECGYR